MENGVFGTLGIGTTGPNSKLDVTGGDIRTSTQGNGFYLYNGTTLNTQLAVATGTNSLVTGSAQGDLVLRQNLNNSILMATNGDNVRMTINGSGNVGIGTTSPGDKLEIDSGGLKFGTTGNTVDFASGVADNTFIWKIPQKSTGDCATATAEGVVIKNTSGTQYGHICINAAGQLKYFAQTFNSANTDLAENYADRDNSLAAGDVVAIDPSTYKGAKKTASSYEPTALGIVSTDPGLTLSGIEESGNTDLVHPKYIALAGRVPTNVSTENGPIEVGDYVTSSNIPGVAMKATKPGPVVGKALEAFDGTIATPCGIDSECGKILVFVNVGYADPQNVLANLTLDSDGSLIIPALKSNKLTLAGVTTVTEPVAGSSIDSATLTQTGQPVSSSATAEADLATVINALSSAQAAESAQLAQVQAQTEVLSAAVASQTATLASVSSQLSSTSAQLASASSDIASQSALLAQTQDDIAKLNLTPPSVLASASASFNAVNVAETLSTLDLSTIDATVSGTLKALGETVLGSTTIAGGLSVDGVFSVSSVSDGSAINALPTLYLQNSPLAEKLDLFNGLVTITKDGSVTAAKYQVDTSNPATASLGDTTVPAGQVSVDVDTSALTPHSSIFATPRNVPVGVGAKLIGDHTFEIDLEHSLAQPVEVSWWIVN